MAWKIKAASVHPEAPKECRLIPPSCCVNHPVPVLPGKVTIALQQAVMEQAKAL